MEQLRQMREGAGLSQSELARRSGVDRATINKVEQGRRSPSIATLESLAVALGGEVADFFPKVEPQLPLHDRAAGTKDSAAGYQALAAWHDYLGLTLTRWEKLRRQFQDLANREPDEERDADDLLRALLDSHEFFRAVDRFHVVVGGFGVPRFDYATNAETRELVWMVRDRAERLGRIAKLFLEYSERLTKAMEDRQSEWAQREVEKFLESLGEEEARTADVR